MDPLITNAIDPTLLRSLEKRGDERDQQPRRRRPVVPAKRDEEETEVELGLDAPKHTLDDLA